MVTGILLLSACIGVLYVVYWTIKNDKVDAPESQTGFLQMRVPYEGQDQKAPKKKWARRGQRRES